LLSLTRAATSNGADLDSWMADYGVTRLGAQFATGNVTFARFTPTFQALIPIGTIVQTSSGSQKYTVIVNTLNSAYNAGLGGYVIAAAAFNVSVPVVANTAGSAGNAQIGLINSIGSGIPYVDTVTNPAAFITGSDAESDAQLRVRFVGYIASLNEGTVAAVQYAVQQLL